MNVTIKMMKNTPDSHALGQWDELWLLSGFFLPYLGTEYVTFVKKYCPAFNYLVITKCKQ